MRRLLTLSLLAATCGLASPAPAQDAPNEKVNMLIVYGDEPCPAGKGDEIVVCARKPEAERFRIPAPFRGEDPNSTRNTSWAERAKSFETVGQFGTNSCSPVGAGGSTGCLAKLIRNAYAERAQPTDVRFGKALEEARAKRAATVDAEAAATQARVEQLEKEYDAKRQAEEDARAGKQPDLAPSATAKAPPPPGG